MLGPRTQQSGLNHCSLMLNDSTRSHNKHCECLQLRQALMITWNEFHSLALGFQGVYTQLLYIQLCTDIHKPTHTHTYTHTKWCHVQHTGQKCQMSVCPKWFIRAILMECNQFKLLYIIHQAFCLDTHQTLFHRRFVDIWQSFDECNMWDVAKIIITFFTQNDLL